MKNILIVTSHYNEDLNWLINQNEYDYKIYTKNKNFINNYNQDKIFDCINKGNEASSYLKFIIDNYDNLPDFTAFIHGHYEAHHQTDNILNLIKGCKFLGYESLNRKDWVNKLNDFTNIEPCKIAWNYVKQNFINLKIKLPPPSKIESIACAQFIVSKENILLNSLEDYNNIFNWLITTELESFWSGRILEYIWCYIMTHNEIEEIF